MVGLGETVDELLETFRDLSETGCDILTVGQYLAPTPKHIPIEKYYSPEEFDYLRKEALEIGFRYVESGPLVRSSYHAGRHTNGAAEAADYSNDPVFMKWKEEASRMPASGLVQLKRRDG
jgi:lipoic acid synthetase